MEFKTSLVYMATSRLMPLLPVLFNIMTSKIKNSCWRRSEFYFVWALLWTCFVWPHGQSPSFLVYIIQSKAEATTLLVCGETWHTQLLADYGLICRSTYHKPGESTWHMKNVAQGHNHVFWLCGSEKEHPFLTNIPIDCNQEFVL